MNVGDILPNRADLLDRPALSVEGVSPISYRELTELRDHYIAALLAAKIRPQDRVGVMLRNCVEYWPIHLAVAAIGAITVRINFRLSHDELAYVLEDSECSLLFIHDSVLSSVKSLPRTKSLGEVVVLPEGGQGDVPTWAVCSDDWLNVEPRKFSFSVDRTSSPHMIMYTSGTTGQPKGAVWTHQSTIMFGAMQLMQWGATSERVSMTVGPLYHVGSMEDLLLPTLMSGGHAVMMRSGQFDLGRALALVSSLRVTDLLLFPAMLYALLDLDDVDQIDVSSLKTLITGGSPLLDRAVRRFHLKFPTVDLWSVYGLTEGGGISTALGPEEGRIRPGAAGRPLPMVSIRIESESGGEASIDQIGEVCVSGPNTANSYWRRSRETEETFVNGWVRTGDLGRVDENGILTVTGRQKDMIRSGDENVYGAEVERVLAEHPSIAESAVIGVPDSRFGEAVCAVIVARTGKSLTISDVIEHCRAHLAGYKKPRYIGFVDELPRNATAKVIKEQLRTMIKEGEVTVLSTESNLPRAETP